MRISLVLVAALAACGSASSKSPADAGDLIGMGQAFVAVRGCPACHQPPDLADGVLSGLTSPIKGTMSYPANLTPDPDTGIGSWSDDEIKRAMIHGIDDEGAPLCPPMPHFDGTGGDGRPMEDTEAASIIAYLRSLPAVHREIPESVCAIKPGEMDMAMPIEADLSTPEEEDMTPPDRG